MLPSVTPFYFLRQGLLLNLELTNFTSLVSQLSLEDHLSLPGFYVCSEVSKLRFSCLAASVLLTVPSPYSSLCFYEINYMLKFQFL